MAHLDTTTTQHSLPLRGTFHHFYQGHGKRLFDLLLALALLPVLAPIIAALCILIRSQGGRALFAHTRVGQDGVPFACWKLRTMLADAETQLAHVLSTDPIAAAEWAKTQKLTNDPRVTRLGRFLRRTSLDELPQLWNVLRGEMSFVGPRPITAPELDRYGLHAQTYLDLKPGITGLWQVTGRTNGCYAERLQLDQTYAQSLGLFQDIKLILRTGLVVLAPTGR